MKQIPILLNLFAIGLTPNFALSQVNESLESNYELTIENPSQPVEIKIIVENGNTKVMTFVENEKGIAIYQGDIILGNAIDFAGAFVTPMNSAISTGLRPFGLARKSSKSLWPQGVMRYIIDPTLSNQSRVTNAIKHWERNTDIRFERLSTPSGDYVRFVPANGCSSWVGRVGGEQLINLSNRCTTGNTIHEVGHALGLNHEQSRDDRNQNVQVIFSNIKKRAHHNFKPDPVRYEDVGKYCTGSIMHYGAYAFAIDKSQKTIVTLNDAAIGQRKGLSQCDISTIQQIYKEEFNKH